MLSNTAVNKITPVQTADEDEEHKAKPRDESNGWHTPQPTALKKPHAEHDEDGQAWLAWVEKQFYTAAGQDREIDFEEFKSALNVKDVFFAERFFKLMDKDGSGKLEVKELISSLRSLTVTGSNDDKLQFLFDVYDVDGSGSISTDEVRTVLSSCMVESSLKLSDEDLDSLTQALFKEMDLDKSGGISCDELKSVMDRHPEIMGNLSLSASQWLKKPQKRPRKVSPFKKYFTKSFLLNNLPLIILIIIYMVLTMLLFFGGAWTYRSFNWCVIVARGCGMCLNFNCCIVLLLMMRVTLTFLRTTGLAHVLPLDEHIQLHKWVGYFIVFFTVGHTLAHVGNAVLVADTPKFNLTVPEYLFTTKAKIGWISGFAHLSGVILVAILFIMLMCSLPIIRRKGYFQHVFRVVSTGFLCFGHAGSLKVKAIYNLSWRTFRRFQMTIWIFCVYQFFEVFYWMHKLYIVFWILLILHATHFYKYFVIPATLYVIELIASSQITRGIRYGNIYIQEVALLPSKVTHLVISRSDHMTYKPGDYVFIKIPAVARFEWHPFTISSAPEMKGTFWLHIRSTGGWTQKLYEYFKHLNTESLPSEKYTDTKQLNEKPQSGCAVSSALKSVHVRAYINGPYGTSTREIFDAEHAVLISTGIGVTPYAAILQSIMYRLKQAKTMCPQCMHTWYDKPPKEYINLRKVDFIWINRDQKSFEWFISLLTALETEQVKVKELMNLQMHMYMTSALSKGDVKGIFLQMALDYFHNKEKRDVITGLKTQTHPGRPDFKQIFTKISQEHVGKVKVFFCGSPVVATQMKQLCDKFDFDFCKEIF